jgi:hypothetical protein
MPNWPPTSDVAREAEQEAERFTELDDNANQTIPADSPNSNHEPHVRRTPGGDAIGNAGRKRVNNGDCQS